MNDINNTDGLLDTVQMKSKIVLYRVVIQMDAKKRIRQLMDERGWSEYRLAKAADLSQSTIANLFRRNNAPTISTLEAICGAFGISLAQFFTEGEEPVTLTSDQRELFNKWVALTDEQKKILFDLMKTM